MQSLLSMQGISKKFAPLIILFCSMGVGGFKLKKGEVDDIQFRPHMQALYQSLTQVLGYALKDSNSLSKKETAEVESQLKILAEQAKAIRVLASQSDKGHQFMATELERSSSLAYAQYQSGNKAQSRIFVSDVLSTCFACHTSRSSQNDSKFTLNFYSDINLQGFEPLAKARFLSISRQFEESASEYEKILLSDNLSDDQFVNFDPMVEYLILILRVKGDGPRALRTFKSIAQRPFPELIKSDLNAWILALKSLESDKKQGSELEQARRLILLAKASMEFPQDRSGLVRYVEASRLLHAYLKRNGLPLDEKAEAYYQLGSCELILGSFLFADEASTYFEETIRLQPNSPLARKAYARYEENLLNGYTGSSGLHLPNDEKLKLENLRKLAF